MLTYSGSIQRLLRLPNGDGEIRTLDPLLARQVLSQLSYTPIIWRPPILPYRLQHSTFGRPALHCRVRDGNGCLLRTHRHQKDLSLFYYIRTAHCPPRHSTRSRCALLVSCPFVQSVLLPSTLRASTRSPYRSPPVLTLMTQQ